MKDYTNILDFLLSNSCMRVSFPKELSYFKSSCKTHFLAQGLFFPYKLGTVSSAVNNQQALKSVLICSQDPISGVVIPFPKGAHHPFRSCWWYSQQNFHSMAAIAFMKERVYIGIGTPGGHWGKDSKGWSRTSPAALSKVPARDGYLLSVKGSHLWTDINLKTLQTNIWHMWQSGCRTFRTAIPLSGSQAFSRPSFHIALMELDIKIQHAKKINVFSPLKLSEWRGTSVPFILWFSVYFLQDFRAKK